MSEPNQSDLQALLKPVMQIALSAGAAILDVYSRDSIVAAEKPDRSPITEADLRANQLILEGLAMLSKLPVLTEEAAEISYDIRRNWTCYWLVDPLDGTKEFLSRNGEFTVNIALIVCNEPVLGVVYAPATRALYAGASGVGAFRQTNGGRSDPIGVQLQAATPVRVVGSRSHRDGQTDAWLKQLGPHVLLPIGSSLKLCLVAEGTADIYPRFSPTSEWDIAAGHAVLAAAGGDVRRLDGKPLRYNTKEDILNPAFIAFGDATRPWLSAV